MRGSPPLLAALKGCATTAAVVPVAVVPVAQAFRPAAPVAQPFRAAHAVSSSSNSPSKIASTPIERRNSAFTGAYKPYAQIRSDGVRRLAVAITAPANHVPASI